MLIDSYLHEMVKVNASDLFLTINCPPSLRVEGNIVALNAPPLDDADMDALIDDMLSEEQRDDFTSTMELNIALSLSTGERFRVNLFRQKHHTGMVIRFIKSEIPSFEQLGLPSIYQRMVLEKRGLVLMVGATGAGKSTSMAAMLNYRNLNSSGHIVTIEDPIEFVHEHKGCIFTQREIGIDTYSYDTALKNALRQSPDVLVIGEIRDRHTLENAILFCEAGHLVIATLHANNANQAIERMVNFFSEEQHHQIMATLSLNINAIVSQRLIAGMEGKRHLAFEVLINEGLITTLIEEGKVTELKDIMLKNLDRGMITFDECLFQMVGKHQITIETALKEADNPSNLRLRFSQDALASKHGVYDVSDSVPPVDAEF